MTDHEPARPARSARAAATASVEAIQASFRARDYIADRSLATAVFLALQLGRPLLLEGEAGVGKTELAKVLAATLGARLIRLQCYEGLDVNTAVYEWNYPRQMLEIRLLEARGDAEQATAHDIFGPEFLIKRPLLQALESTDGAAPVLLIDEIDRADEEFEAYLLEILSDFQVTVPEIGTIKAEHPPRVILTSNRTREVHDALKRRCLYHWIDYPTQEKEYEIVLARVPTRRSCSPASRRVRPSPAGGRPDQGPRHRRDAGLGRGAAVARRDRADPEVVDETLGVVLKYEEDIRHVRGEAARRYWPRRRPAASRPPSSRRDGRPDRPRDVRSPLAEIDGRHSSVERSASGGRCGWPAGDRPRRGDRLRSRPEIVDIGDREQVRAAGEAVFVRRRDDRRSTTRPSTATGAGAARGAEARPSSCRARTSRDEQERARRRRPRRRPADRGRPEERGTPVPTTARRPTRRRDRGRGRLARRLQQGRCSAIANSTG